MFNSCYSAVVSLSSLNVKRREIKVQFRGLERGSRSREQEAESRDGTVMALDSGSVYPTRHKIGHTGIRHQSIRWSTYWGKSIQVQALVCFAGGHFRHLDSPPRDSPRTRERFSNAR